MDPDAPAAPARPGCLPSLLFAAAGLWTIMATFTVQMAAWGVGQDLLIQQTPWPPFAWTLVSWTNGLLLAMPLLPLALLGRTPRFRAAYQTWTLALAFLGVLALARLFPESQTQPAALARILLGLLCTAALLRLAARRGYGPRLSLPALLPALAFAPLVSFPWLLLGALGSPLDALLDLLAGLTLGLFAGLLCDAFLMAPLTARSRGAGWDIALGGFAAGVALLLLGAGFGFAGSQLLLMAALPPLGFAAAALGRAAEPGGHAWLPMAGLLGLAASAPLMFFDPNELTLLLDGSDVPGWATLAAGLSILLGWTAGLVLWALRGRAARRRRLGSWGLSLAALWIAALLLYLFAGQPGFHGEQLFVLLRDQADLSRASSLADRAERGRYVYRTLADHAEASQAGLRATLDRFGVEYRPYYLVNALEVNGGPLLRLYLSRQPEVDRILDSPHLRPLPAPMQVQEGQEGPPSRPQWNITSLGADRVWREFGVTGRGIVVGQSDTGVDGGHPALREGYRGRQEGDDYDWLDPWNGTTSPTDLDGHGTHTLGSALGRQGLGVAPGAEWFGCVNLARNLGNPALYLDCMQFMLAPYPLGGDPFRDGDPARAAHVTNNSWGCPPEEGCDAGALEPAVRALRAAGIYVVASAGNAGPRCESVSDPIAIYKDAFTVGAADEEGNVAFFSSRGPVTVDGSRRLKPDLLAPGVDILSAYPEGSYEIASGTSMAGPHVAGVVALMWSAQPRLIGDVEQTDRILIETARPYRGQPVECSGGEEPIAAYGHGLVDAYAAVKAALALP